ncbi:hypothetical protein GAMM_280011 [Gammaproteobacteria bacterium]
MLSNPNYWNPTGLPRFTIKALLT